MHYTRRDLVNACSYVLRTGRAWRLLPDTFPPWQAVYKAFSRWVDAGVFEQMQDRLREQWRTRMGRASTPSAAVIDAQSTRASPQGGESGFDAGKKVKGRKRNLVVDTMGLLIAVTVTAASMQDRDAAAAVVAQACAKSHRLEKLYTDQVSGRIGAPAQARQLAAPNHHLPFTRPFHCQLDNKFSNVEFAERWLILGSPPKTTTSNEVQITHRNVEFK